ncbi:MAG: S-methyl-5-thioribose-1-phosphate isomerase, partial [Candidatus Latescibacterota bacterium]|nr:S-methyl-5-thioribose-1-phosphate isomerase [Candidatus Latescibacterota bacterium]
MTDTHTLRWCDEDAGWLELLDQTLLPQQIQFIECRDVETVAEATAKSGSNGGNAGACLAMLCMFAKLVGATSGEVVE